MATGACFRQFWDPRGQVPSPAPGSTDDISAIDGWSAHQLGAHLAASDLEMLVLLIRGELLHRYPNLAHEFNRLNDHAAPHPG